MLSNTSKHMIVNDYYDYLNKLKKYNKNVNSNNLSAVNSLYGYSSVVPKYNVSLNFTSSNTHHELGYLYLHSDGLLFILYDKRLIQANYYYNNNYIGNYYKILNGQSLFIPRNYIYDVKYNNGIWLTYYDNYDNQLETIIIKSKSLFSNNPLFSQLQSYLGSFSTNSQLWINRMNQKATIINDSIRPKLQQDWLRSHKTVGSQLRKCFSRSIDTTETNLEYAFNLGLIFGGIIIILLIALLFSWVLNNYAIVGLSCMPLFLIGVCLIVSNTSKRLNDMGLSTLWDFLIVIPFLDIVFILFLCLKPSSNSLSNSNNMPDVKEFINQLTTNNGNV